MSLLLGYYRLFAISGFIIALLTQRNSYFYHSMSSQPITSPECPLCFGRDIVQLFSKQGILYYKCRSCGFVFSQPDNNPNLTNTIADYEPAYLDYFNEKIHDKKNHDLLVGLIEKQRKLEGARILDVGCGSGKFVKYLRTKGYAAFGLEPSRALYDAFLSRDYFFNTTISDFLIHHPGEEFDIIIVSDVLEHIDKPLPFIKDIRSIMSDGAILFISTPDTSSLLARLSGKSWHYYNRYHLSLFSKANLIDTGAKNGVTAVSSGTVTRYQSIYYVIKYLFNFILHKKGFVPKFLSRMHLPINLFDNMYVIFKKV